MFILAYPKLDKIWNNTLTINKMENLDKAFTPGYITTSLNGKVVEVTKAEAEKRGVGNYYRTVLRTCKK